MASPDRDEWLEASRQSFVGLKNVRGNKMRRIEEATVEVSRITHAASGDSLPFRVTHVGQRGGVRTRHVVHSPVSFQ